MVAPPKPRTHTLSLRRSASAAVKSLRVCRGDHQLRKKKAKKTTGEPQNYWGPNRRDWRWVDISKLLRYIGLAIVLYLNHRFFYSAPSLGVYYFLSLTLSVCLYVCLSVTLLLRIDSSFLFLDGIEPFFGRHLSMWHSTKRCS